MAESAVLADTVGVRPHLAYPLLAKAIAWAPLSLGDEPTNGQPTEEEASQSAEVPAAVVLAREAIEQALALIDAGDAEGAIALPGWSCTSATSLRSCRGLAAEQ